MKTSAKLDIFKLKKSELITMYIELNLDFQRSKQEALNLNSKLSALQAQNSVLEGRLQKAVVEYRKLRDLKIVKAA